MCDVKYQPTEEELKQVSNIPRVLSYKYKYHDPEEIESLANVGLAKGIPKYDPNRGMKFCEWVYWYCLREIRMYFKSVGYMSKIGTLSISEYEWVLCSKNKDEIELLEIVDLANHLLSKVSGLDRDILLLYFQGVSYKEIGRRFNLGPQTIREKCSSAILRIRHGKDTRDSKYRVILKKWAINHPDEYKRNTLVACKKGVIVRLKKMKREKRLMGWESLTIGECKVLCLMADRKGRTVNQLADQLQYNIGHIRRIVLILRKGGYLISKWNGKHCCLYSITEKAIKERRKSNG